jgi:hypothetical protein
MKSTYFTIHPDKNPPPQNGCRLKSAFCLLKHQFHILHFPNSTGLFTKPTGRHYPEYWFSRDIAAHPGRMSLNQVFEVICGVHHRQVIGYLEARLSF